MHAQYAAINDLNPSPSAPWQTGKSKAHSGKSDVIKYLAAVPPRVKVAVLLQAFICDRAMSRCARRPIEQGAP